MLLRCWFRVIFFVLRSRKCRRFSLYCVVYAELPQNHGDVVCRNGKWMHFECKSENSGGRTVQFSSVCSRDVPVHETFVKTKTTFLVIDSRPRPKVWSNGVDLTGLLGDIKEDWGSGGRSPPEAEAFFVKLHIIFALKYNKQQLLSLSPTS